MVVVIDNKQLSRYLLSGAVTLLLSLDVLAQSIRFTGDRVVVDKLDGEVLYTFVRYQDRQEVWNDVFPVRVSGASLNITGTYVVGDSSVSFVPAFPFAKGVDYEATFHSVQLTGNTNEVYLPPMSAGVLNLKFKLKTASSDVPSVVAVFPTANELPENLLRFHIEFSSSMTRGEVYERVHIFDENKNEVDKALLVVDEELWDDDMKSVTIMLDPGRIKRGLKANLEMSAPLIAGKSYTLVIEPGWKNADGLATTEHFEKIFKCYAADRSKPQVRGWTLVPPASPGGNLVLRMNEFYDVVLLRRAIIVKDVLGNRVAGKLLISDNESVISFVPFKPWSGEKYSVMVNPALEDLAGNNLVRLFDTDVKEKEAGEKDLRNPITFVVQSGLE
jgi:hypothetical protein